MIQPQHEGVGGSREQVGPHSQETRQLVRRLLEEQEKVLRSYFAQKGGALSKGWGGSNYEGREHVQGTSMREDGERRSWLSEPMPNKWEAWKLGSFCLLFSLVLLSLLSLSLIKSSC